MLNIYLICVLALGAYNDLRYRIMPNKIILPSIAIAAVIALIRLDYRNLILGLLVLFVVYVLFRYKLLGGGDAKGIVFISLLKGSEFLMTMGYYVAIISIPMMIYYKIKHYKEKEKRVFPLYVPILFASIYVLWGV